MSGSKKKTLTSRSLLLPALALVLLGLGTGCRSRASAQKPSPGPDLKPTYDAGIVDSGTGILLDAGTTASTDASAPIPDAGTPTTDAGSSAPDATPAADASTSSDDGGTTTPPACNEVVFEYDNGTASSVWVTGTFTNWGATPAGGALAMTQSGSRWSVTTTIQTPGAHLYKFIVDGSSWIDDSNNPERVADGYGGFNSVLHVCEGGTFRVLTHQTDASARTFSATVEYSGSGNLATPTVTVDHVPAVAGSWSVSGRNINLQISSLADGIHDIRLGVGSDDLLLKAYINESTDWRDTLLYFVMTDRFRNGNPANDNPVGGLSHPLTDYLGGDFAGIKDAIESGYFDALGVNALWISWPMDNAEGSWSGPYETYSGCNRTGQTSTLFSGYHGYWPTSGRNVEARFGTEAELVELATRAHARGIRILLDFTSNHVHQDSPYYAAQGSTWFNQPATLCRDGHWDSSLKEECWFDSFLPDWNFTNADARKQVIDDALWVAKRVGADGFRVDALKHMEDAFITDLQTRVQREMEQTGVEFYLVGETFTGDLGLINYYVQPSMLDGQFDFPSNMAIRKALATDEIGLAQMHQWVRSNKASYGASAPLMSTFVGNHDIARFVSKAAGDLPCGVWSVSADVSRAHDSPPGQPSQDWPYKKLELALTYAYAVPGVPLLYYGDEVGLAGAGDPDNRRMLPSDSALNGLQTATRSFVETLGRARADHAVLRRGDWTDALYADDTLLVFARTLGADVALVVLNRGGDRTVNVDVGTLGLGSGATLTRVLHGGAATVQGSTVEISISGLSSEIFVN